MKYAFINGILLNGTKDMVPQIGKVVLTDEDRIEAVQERKGTILSDYEIIDLDGSYIMPGLINMHVHLPASGKPKKKQQDSAKAVRLITSSNFMKRIGIKMCIGYAEMELMSGVTTLRTVGGVANFDTFIRDLIEEGSMIGPRILAADMAISVPGGHMAGSLAFEAHSVEEVRSCVRKIARTKPDLIKIMITGGVLDATKKGEPGEMKMSPELVKTACEEAHKLGLPVAAHVESPQGVKVALENGVDTIEHGAKTDAEIISLFKDTGACHISTLSPALPYALFDCKVSHATELSKYNGDVVFEGIIDCTKKCLENGIPVGLGTDTGCPFITHYDMWRELFYFQKYCEVTNQFALYTATLGNATILGMEDEIGSIEAGKCADLIVSKENPLENLAALRNLEMVVTKGMLLEKPVIKKYKNVEKELDKFLK